MAHSNNVSERVSFTDIAFATRTIIMCTRERGKETKDSEICNLSGVELVLTDRSRMAIPVTYGNLQNLCRVEGK